MRNAFLGTRFWERVFKAAKDCNEVRGHLRRKSLTQFSHCIVVMPDDRRGVNK